ncbi:hypothetical protein [Oceanobacillus neutriphilus]|uniref:Uncharacterized protein n=1 Tax=Oceanobacillus neutriphilus TaxID=531815 RepID=A0ABQ2NWB5_9BACI|nr:hypothetical protein [Oceanobacillus neutriphilus]GGP12130.1 hypothetical protein GCM10011346_26900 [Oceanobacillus neutriphilus]
MSIKKWVSIGIIYVCVVVIAYGVITGKNPFESKDIEPHDHAAGQILEVNQNDYFI